MENIFPHIMYIADTEYKYDRNHMYLGGEPPENDSRLTIGKRYILRTVMYSENADSLNRRRIWVCSDDENKGKLCRIHLKNFGEIDELRDRKLKQIIDENK